MKKIVKEILQFLFKLIDTTIKILRNIIPNIILALFPAFIGMIFVMFFGIFLIFFVEQFNKEWASLLESFLSPDNGFLFKIIYGLSLLSLVISDFYGSNWLENLRGWAFNLKK